MTILLFFSFLQDYKVGGDASVTENEFQIVDLSMELAAQPTNQTQTRASKKKPRNRGTRHTEAPVLLASETMLVHKSKAMLRENEALETISNTGTVRSRLTEFVVASTTSLIDSTLACFTTGRKRRRVRMSVSFAFEFVCEEVEEQSIENVGFNQVDSS